MLICNPRLVSTGLGLVNFPTVVFYEPEYSAYLIMQASRRTWRLGQTEPVEVYLAVYGRTMEHQTVAHVGKEVATAHLLHGDAVAGSLVDQARVGGSFLAELAREVVANAEIPDLTRLFVEKHRAVENTCPGRPCTWPSSTGQVLSQAPVLYLPCTWPSSTGQVQARYRAQDSGWFLGANGPDLSDRRDDTLLSVSASELTPVDPRQSVQLTLF